MSKLRPSESMAFISSIHGFDRSAVGLREEHNDQMELLAEDTDKLNLHTYLTFLLAATVINMLQGEEEEALVLGRLLARAAREYGELYEW